MHCEQNLLENILKIITRHKDIVKVRRDLQRRGIRKHLWLTNNPKKTGKMLKLAAPYVLTTEEFDIFASTIESLKTPSGHISNISPYIQKKNFEGLNSHDYHVLMQQILPLVLRGLLQPGPRMAVMRIFKVFRRICNKVWNPFEFQGLCVDIA